MSDREVKEYPDKEIKEDRIAFKELSRGLAGSESASLDNEREILAAMKVAEDEFQRFADSWRLDTEVLTMSEEDREDFESERRKILLRIRDKSAAVDAEGNIVYTLFEPVGALEKVTIKRPRGYAYLDMDNSKEGKNMKKMARFIGASIGQPVSVISKLDGIDMKFFMSVYNLFLGS